MSTTENVNPTEPIEEDDTFRLSIDQPVAPQPAMQPEYDGAPASEAPDPAAEVTTPSGKKLLRIDMGNGKYFTAETERELLQKVVDAQKEASRYIEELKQAKQAPQPAATSLTVNPRAPLRASIPIPDGEYSDQTYLDLLGKDTVAARIYQDRYIYGDIDPVQALQHSYKISNQIQQEMLVAEFRRQNEDFRPEYAEPILKILNDHNMAPDTVPNLEWAFNHAKKNGQIKAGSISPEGETEFEDIDFSTPPRSVGPAPRQQNQPQRRGANAPQAVRGGGTGGDTASPIDPWSVPLETLRDAIEKKGVRR